MRFMQIQVASGRTLPHPTRSFANIRSSVAIVACLEDGEDLASAAGKLQSGADALVDAHVERITEREKLARDFPEVQTEEEEEDDDDDDEIEEEEGGEQDDDGEADEDEDESDEDDTVHGEEWVAGFDEGYGAGFEAGCSHEKENS